MDIDCLDADALATYRARIEGYMTKAIREAKAMSSWTNPDEAYEAAVSEFLHRILDLKESHFIGRSEEHTSELQSLMRISYAVFCLKKKTTKHTPSTNKIY